MNWHRLPERGIKREPSDRAPSAVILAFPNMKRVIPQQMIWSDEDIYIADIKY